MLTENQIVCFEGRPAEYVVRDLEHEFLFEQEWEYVEDVAYTDEVDRDIMEELHASLATKHLGQPEIDFLHGRISTSVFMANYFNANLISDLKERTFSSINEILKQI